jgi:hypothetical protein
MVVKMKRKRMPDKRKGKTLHKKKEVLQQPSQINKPIDKKTQRETQEREFIETDVDKLYELVRDRGIIKIKDASKMLKVDEDKVEEWGRILEEHKLIRMRYPPIGEPVLILKKFTTESEKIKKLKTKKRKPMKMMILIILLFVCFFAFYALKLPPIRITYSQAYLITGLIIIIGVLIILFKLFKIKKGKKNAGKVERSK